MRVCIITTSYPLNKQDYVQAPFVLDFARNLIARGHKVFIYTQDRKGRKETVIDNVEVKWYKWKLSDKRIAALSTFKPADIPKILSLITRGRKELIKFIKENKIEVCLALWIIPNGYFAYYAHKKLGIPYSVWALGSDIIKYGRNPAAEWIMRKVVNYANGVFADGFELSRRVENIFNRKCHFLATTRSFSNIEEEDVKINPAKYSFLFVGRWEKEKGADILIQAMNLLIKDNIEANLYLAGGGSLRSYIKNEISREGMEQNIILLDYISNEKLVSAFKNCNCVVIPSRLESIPLVLSEALNFDKDLVVTDVGDMGYLAREYKIAEIVPCQDPRALKEAMKKMALGEMGIDRVRNKNKRDQLKRLFNIETSVKRFLEDYEIHQS